MELQEHVRVLFAHRKLIIVVTLVTFLVAGIGAFFRHPKFEARTTVLMKSALNQPKLTASGVGESQDNQTKGETLTKILTSRSIAEKIVDDLHLDQQIAVVQSSRPSTLGTFVADAQRTLGTMISGSVARPDPMRQLAASVQKSISASLLRNTYLIEIRVLWGDPEKVAAIANSAAKKFVDLMKDMNSTEATVAREFIAERVIVAKADLDKTQDDLRQFIVREGVVYPGKTTDASLGELVRFQSELKTATAEIEQARVRVQEIQQQLAKYDSETNWYATMVASPGIQDLKRKLIDLELEKATLSVDNGPLHPKMLTLDKEIEKIRGVIGIETRQLAASKLATVSPLHDQLVSELIAMEIALGVSTEKKRAFELIVDGFPAELVKLAHKRILWETLEDAVKFAQNNLDSLKTQLEMARIAEVQTASEVKVVDRAIPPTGPTGFPRIMYPFLGLIVGLMAGVGLAFFLEYVDDSIRNLDTMEEELKMPVYAVIPNIKLQKRSVLSEEARRLGVPTEERLLMHFAPQSPIAEAYRSFRTNIQLCGLKGKSKILLVTSSLKGEGKTTTVANLGIALAQLNNRVLLIDADMRNPTLDRVFGKPRDPGLSMFLGGVKGFRDVIIPSGIENLDLVPSGIIPPNPSELLNSARMKELLASAASEYEFVLFDTPPIIPVTDAAVLSSHVDGVFLVVRWGKTSKPICMRARALLEKAKANVLGCVVNNVSVEHNHGYEHYYHGYYGDTHKSDKA